MCRMIGVWSEGGVDPEIFERFADKCKSGCGCEGSSPGHMDGWGLGTFTEDGWPLVVKSGKPPIENEEFLRAAEEFARRDSVILHLRKASDRSSVSDEKSHPFVYDGNLFAHNGGVSGYPSFAESGKIDTEFLGEELLADFDRNDPEGSLLKALEKWHQTGREFDAICLLVGLPDRIIAYREYSIYPTKATPEAKEAYYTLYYHQENEAQMVASEPLEGFAGWELLRNRTMVSFGKAGRQDRPLRLSEAATVGE